MRLQQSHFLSVVNYHEKELIKYSSLDGMRQRLCKMKGSVDRFLLDSRMDTHIWTVWESHFLTIVNSHEKELNNHSSLDGRIQSPFEMKESVNRFLLDGKINTHVQVVWREGNLRMMGIQIVLVNKLEIQPPRNQIILTDTWDVEISKEDLKTRWKRDVLDTFDDFCEWEWWKW